ncbi:MAG TPA: DUF5009 domain-containing protein [Lunatimonas sp.]|nr:DUF5009 domain-containing protein [Lunatimonas sp.]
MEMTQVQVTGNRRYVIDVFRALTMLLMIFVNDLWSLREIPLWLGHVPSSVDGMGLADVVFPMFLFIVGLSIPYAISNRIKKGESNASILSHILVRSMALLIMGVYHVNLESYNRELAILPKPVWQIAITVGFFLVWLDFSSYKNPKVKKVCQSVGIVLLITLAAIYRGGTLDEPQWMRFHWWGILGLIGWGYLVVSLLFLWCKGNINWLWVMFTALLSFSVIEKLGWLDAVKFIRPYFWLIDNGALPAICMAGVIVSIYFREYFAKGKLVSFWSFLVSFAVGNILFGLLTRPLWGIHKIGSSPSWVTLCIGISIFTFMLLIWLVEIQKKKEWFSWIKPAGTSTLTCYLLPYIHYGLLSLSGLTLPVFLRTGGIGIMKSLVYALIIIMLTGILEKFRIRLKI